MTDRPTKPLREVAAEPTFRTIGVSIRFVESEAIQTLERLIRLCVTDPLKHVTTPT